MPGGSDAQTYLMQLLRPGKMIKTLLIKCPQRLAQPVVPKLVTVQNARGGKWPRYSPGVFDSFSAFNADKVCEW